MDNDFFNSSVFELDQAPVGHSFTSGVIPSTRDVSQGRFQNPECATDTYEPARDRRTTNQTRKGATQQFKASTRVPPSRLKSGNWDVAQRAPQVRNMIDERIDDLEKIQAHILEELQQLQHKLDRIETKLAEWQKTRQESESSSEMMMQVAQAASVALNSVLGNPLASNTAD
ncbi:uncharacterized protein Z519_12310 [Cladophialophora bantiana CBS 173.52]|uniref:Uncharacterized protein n=1 Tax=Cladophialophora bantiana (strain ATCC 10958 / CBS 173.52 / CDC B-1940 / NIH 8579) TaxID=1442370 RepID=A0A0D2H1C3_CLAB1|nr:uncharacterized protein Z519_12310 [Cladophialophora bantiana CBS 173.52]KIW87013.1 hypothetical protein Z519_12310 [Cladophialophora bantiana CBS 173.52]